MNPLTRGTMVLMIAGLMLVMIFGSALAQNGEQNWDKTHPVEYYGAYQIALDQYQEEQLGMQNWDKVHPVEYYGTYQLAQTEMNIAWTGVQNWDKTHPVEYYGAYLQTLEDLQIVKANDVDNVDAPCEQC